MRDQWPLSLHLKIWSTRPTPGLVVRRNKTKGVLGSTFNTSSTKSNPLLSAFQKKKQLTGYYTKNAKKTEPNRSASFNKRPAGTMATPVQRCNSGSTKRKKPKDSPKSTIGSQMYSYSSTSAASKFLAGKSLNKYASVDQLFDNKKALSKPGLKLKTSKITSKQSKNSSVDNMFQRSLLDNELKYSNKAFPTNLKVKKEKSKIKKKGKQEVGFLNKQYGSYENGKSNSQGPLSINIVNTNHLHLSGYANHAKPTSAAQNSVVENDKKENFQSIIKSFKPNQVGVKNAPVSGEVRDEDRTKAYKQDLRTTKPNKPNSKLSGM